MREQWNSTQPTYNMAFDQVIRRQIEIAIVQLSRRLQSLNVVVIHIKMKPCHCFMSRGVITWSFGGNVYQNERVPLIHFTWLNHVKIIQSRALNLHWWKDPFLQDKWSFIMWYSDKWRASYYNFYKSFKAWNLKDRKTVQ